MWLGHGRVCWQGSRPGTRHGGAPSRAAAIFRTLPLGWRACVAPYPVRPLRGGFAAGFAALGLAVRLSSVGAVGARGAGPVWVTVAVGIACVVPVRPPPVAGRRGAAVIPVAVVAGAAVVGRWGWRRVGANDVGLRVDVHRWLAIRGVVGGLIVGVSGHSGATSQACCHCRCTHKPEEKCRHGPFPGVVPPLQAP